MKEATCHLPVVRRVAYPYYGSQFIITLFFRNQLINNKDKGRIDCRQHYERMNRPRADRRQGIPIKRHLRSVVIQGTGQCHQGCFVAPLGRGMEGSKGFPIYTIEDNL